MHHFTYRNGVMHAEAVDLIELATRVGTPFYCYSTATLQRHYQVFADAVAGLGDGNPLVAFAVKANPNLSVLATLAAVFGVAYSLRFIHDVFFNGEPVGLDRVPHEPPALMRVLPE